MNKRTTCKAVSSASGCQHTLALGAEATPTERLPPAPAGAGVTFVHRERLWLGQAATGKLILRGAPRPLWGRRGGQGDCAPFHITGQASGASLPQGEAGAGYRSLAASSGCRALGSNLPLRASGATFEDGDDDRTSGLGVNGGGRLARGHHAADAHGPSLPPQAGASPQDGADSPWQIPPPTHPPISIPSP